MRTFLRGLKYVALYLFPLFCLGGEVVLFLHFRTFEASFVHYALAVAAAFGGYLVGRFFHSLFHETGHLIFGLCNGFAFCQMRFGPLELRKTNGKYTLKFNFKNRYAGNLTVVSTRPEEAEKRMARMTFGGIFGSALFTLLCLLPYCFPGMNSYWFAFSATFLPPSLYLLLLNAMPFCQEGVYTDGALLKGFRKREAGALIAARLSVIQSLLFGGVRPKDLDPDYFEGLPVAADNDVNKIQMQVYRYAKALDEGDEAGQEACVRFLEEHWEDLPDIFRDSVRTDICYHNITVRRDLEKAKDQFTRLKPFLNEDLNVCNLRIRMAYELYCQEKPRLAIQTGKTAREVAPSFPLPGIAAMELDLIAGMETVAREQADREKKRTLSGMGELTPYRG